MPTPKTGLVIEIFSTEAAAAERIEKYWKGQGATVTGPTAYIDAVFTDKTSDPAAQITASTRKNCVWAITAVL